MMIAAPIGPPRFLIIILSVFLVTGSSFALAEELAELCDIHINSEADSIKDNKCSPGNLVRIKYKFKSDAFELKNHPSEICDYSKTIFAQTDSENTSAQYIVSCVYGGTLKSKESFFELIKAEPKDNEESAAWKYRKKGP